MKHQDKSFQQLKILRRNIRKARISKNYTQSQVAMEIGLSQNAYSKIELGQTKITVEILLLLSTFLDVSFYDMMDGVVESNLLS